MDKSRQDQTIGIRHLENDEGDYFAGLQIWDRPHTSLIDFNAKYDAIEKMPDEAARKAAFQEMRDTGEFGAQRIVVGKLRDKSAMIALCDAKGKPRIQISVDATGNPKLVFMDEAGEEFFTLPEE